MSTPHVILKLPDGDHAVVPAGGIVGRLETAAARVDDPRVSEAHGLVSLRGRTLKLLSLRGWFVVDGQRVPEVDLRPGLRVELAPGLCIEVEAVRLPSRVLALSGLGGEGGAVHELSAPIYSVLPGETPALPPELRPGYQPEALAWLWSTADGWRMRVGDEEALALEPGCSLGLGGHQVEVLEQPLDQAGVSETLDAGHFHPPLRILARYETAHIVPQGAAPVVLAGNTARIVSELVQTGVPTPWAVVAQEIWGADAPVHQVRTNWDRNMRYLRKKLRDAGIRADLVRPDGKGNVELFLMPGDEVVDET